MLATPVYSSPMFGHYEVYHTPDDQYSVNLWWLPETRSPLFLSPYTADAWAKSQGGLTRHRTPRC